VYGVSANVILDSACRAITSWDIVTSCIKSWVFGTIIAVVRTFLSAHVPVAGAVAAMLSDALSCFFAQCHFLVFASMLHVQSSTGSPSSL